MLLFNKDVSFSLHNGMMNAMSDTSTVKRQILHWHFFSLFSYLNVLYFSWNTSAMVLLIFSVFLESYSSFLALRFLNFGTYIFVLSFFLYCVFKTVIISIPYPFLYNPSLPFTCCSLCSCVPLSLPNF